MFFNYLTITVVIVIVNYHQIYLVSRNKIYNPDKIWMWIINPCSIYRYWLMWIEWSYKPSLSLIIPLIFLKQVLLQLFLQHDISLVIEILQLQRQSHHPNKQLIIDLILFILWTNLLQVNQQLLFLNLQAHCLKNRL